MIRWLEFTLWYLGRRPPWDTGISPPELMAFIGQHPPGRALDLGCGTGTNARTLAQHGWRVTGVDFAHPAIRQAQRKARQAGVGKGIDFRTGDVTRLDGVGGPFDLILDIGCYHGLSAHDRQVYRDNLSRLLAPDGTVLLYLHLRDDREGHGLPESELGMFAPALRLERREDGMDGQRRSVWVTLRRR